MMRELGGMARVGTKGEEEEDVVVVDTASLEKDQDTESSERSDEGVDPGSDERGVLEDVTKARLRKLEVLLQAKDNSIKTFISKTDSLTNELITLKSTLQEKETSLRSVNDSLMVVAERCSVKTKQVEEQEEAISELSEKNLASQSEVDSLRRKMTDLESEVADYERLHEENETAIRSQKQHHKRKEDDWNEMRRDLEDTIDRERQARDASRRQAERYQNECKECYDQISKLKEKLESEKNGRFTEIQQLDADKSSLVSRCVLAESQLKKVREENGKIQETLAAVETAKEALQNKLNSVNREQALLRERLSAAETRSTALATENKAAAREQENLRIELETAVQQKTTLAGRVGALQRECEEAKDETVKHATLVEELKRLNQQQGSEITALNTHSAEITKASLEEGEEGRKRWEGRLREAEQEMSRLTKRLKESERKKIEQANEIEKKGAEVSQLRKQMAALGKSQEETEKRLTGHMEVERNALSQCEIFKRRMGESALQLASLTKQKEEDEDAKRELQERIRSLQDTVSEMESEKDASDRKMSEMSAQLSKVQEQYQMSLGRIEDVNLDLEKANGRADKNHKELLLTLEQQTNSLAEKEEEMEIVKDTCRGTINLLKGQLEGAEAEINKLCVIKRDLEQEVLLLQSDMDLAEGTINELNNEIPRQQDILEQLNVSLGEVSARCEALQEALVRADMRASHESARSAELEDALKKEEGEKRSLEQDMIDMENKVFSEKSRAETLQETVSKFEQQVTGLETALEGATEEKGAAEAEKRRLKELVVRLEAENQDLHEMKTFHTDMIDKLRVKIKEIAAEQEQLLVDCKNGFRARTRTLENRVAELECGAEASLAKETETEKTVKRLERQAREMEVQIGEDCKSLARQVEQITALNHRNKQLKQLLVDSEGRVNSLQSKLRKVTTEMEDSECRAATMSKLLSTPAASRCGTPASMRQSGVWGSRSRSRLTSLMTPEVEQIIMSGRNTPAHFGGGLFSGRNTPYSEGGGPLNDHHTFPGDNSGSPSSSTDIFTNGAHENGVAASAEQSSAKSAETPAKPAETSAKPVQEASAKPEETTVVDAAHQDDGIPKKLNAKETTANQVSTTISPPTN